MPGGRYATQRKDAVARIRQLIDEGRFAVGTPLPSERELARLLKLPQPTIHRAIAALEHDGVLAPAVGRSRLVRAPEPGALVRTIVILGGGRLAKHAETGAFSDSLVQQAHERAAALGFASLAFDPKRLDDQALTGLIVGRPLGVVVTDLGFDMLRDRHILEALRRARIPMASADCSGDRPACDLALSDQAAGADLLVRWLHGRGCRRMAMAWNTEAVDRWWYPMRVAGYRGAVRQLGLQAQPQVLAAPMPSRIDFWKGRKEAETWIDEQGRHWVGWLLETMRGQRLDAILAGDDATAIAVLRALAIIGASGVQVVGYDANATAGPLGSTGLLPAASIDKCYGSIGTTLVDLIAERADGRLKGPPVTRLVEPVLVAGN